MWEPRIRVKKPFSLGKIRKKGLISRRGVSRKSLWRKIREAGWPLCNLSMLWLEGRSPEVANADFAE